MAGRSVYVRRCRCGAFVSGSMMSQAPSEPELAESVRRKRRAFTGAPSQAKAAPSNRPAVCAAAADVPIGSSTGFAGALGAALTAFCSLATSLLYLRFFFGSLGLSSLTSTLLSSAFESDFAALAPGRGATATLRPVVEPADAEISARSACAFCFDASSARTASGAAVIVGRATIAIAATADASFARLAVSALAPAAASRLRCPAFAAAPAEVTTAAAALPARRWCEFLPLTLAPLLTLPCAFIALCAVNPILSLSLSRFSRFSLCLSVCPCCCQCSRRFSLY